jgi:plastocyanin
MHSVHIRRTSRPIGILWSDVRRIGRKLLLLPGAAVVLAACGEVPEVTQDARGVIGDAPPGIALAVAFVVITLAIIAAAVGADRWVRSRRELAAASTEPAEPEEEEEDEPVVAGIGQGTAAVPRWLYGFYIVIPVFAILYVLNAVAFEELAVDPEETPPPAVTDTWEVVAENIQFDTDFVTLPANTEVTIVFDNQDSVPHDIVIFTDDTMDEDVYATDIFTGPETREFTFTSPDPGEYYFHCSVHPAMDGWIEFVDPAELEEPDVAADTVIELVAENIQFDTDEIVVPAGEELTLIFENRDGVPHDFILFTDETMTEDVFGTDLYTGPVTEEYTFTVDEPGEYYFHCSVHPAMDGTLIAE